MYIDDQWLRINPETDTNGDRINPRMARSVRGDSGMVIGRMVKHDDGYILELYRHGDFVEVKRFDGGVPVSTLYADIEREINGR